MFGSWRRHIICRSVLLKTLDSMTSCALFRKMRKVLISSTSSKSSRKPKRRRQAKVFCIQ